MTEAELAAFLDEQRTVIVATNGRDGWPHLMPLWYVVRDGELWAWTYARSQKVRNLERDPRATWQVEAGTRTSELRGVMVKARVRAAPRVETVAAFGDELFVRYTGTDPLPDAGARDGRARRRRSGWRCGSWPPSRRSRGTTRSSAGRTERARALRSLRPPSPSRCAGRLGRGVSRCGRATACGASRLWLCASARFARQSAHAAPT